MHAKNFERVVRFIEFQPTTGSPIRLPLVSATLITPTNSRIFLSLLFDTGADVTTLRADLSPMLGLQSWDEGQRVSTSTASGIADAYQYRQLIVPSI